MPKSKKKKSKNHRRKFFQIREINEVSNIKSNNHDFTNERAANNKSMDGNNNNYKHRRNEKSNNKLAGNIQGMQFGDYMYA